MKRNKNTVTPQEMAEMKGVAYTTVMTWLQNGRIPEARKVDYPRGPVWEIPLKAAEAFQPAGIGGRPKGAKNKPKGKAASGATGTKKAAKGKPAKKTAPQPGLFDKAGKATKRRV